MNQRTRALLSLVAGLSFASCTKTSAKGPVVGITSEESFKERHAQEAFEPLEGSFATVNGVKIHYLSAGTRGKGTPVVLLHGYAETSRMWRPLMAKLAGTHAVIAPDLRGAGESEKPEQGYDKKTMAADIHALVESLGHKQVKIVGHDIGMMVAYAYAAEHPGEVESIVLMDSFLPGVGNWKEVLVTGDWRFHFNGEVPLKLVEGRERTYLEHFWNDLAANPANSVSEADRKFYATEYAKPGAMRAGFEYYKSLSTDADDFASFSQTKLTVPTMVLAGEKASGQFLIDQACLVAQNVEGVVVLGAGHWLMEEAPSETSSRLVEFLDRNGPIPGTSCTGKSPSELRLTAKEIEGHDMSGASSNEIRTSVLRGDPKKNGLYTIVLRIPPNTRIAPHRHADDRVATVLSGTWYLGYGKQFDEKALKALSPGSFYTESPNAPHFAKTGATSAVVQISGVGPTSTVDETHATK